MINDIFISIFTSILEGIRALQCRDCLNVCHEKCRPLASCKPCRRHGTSGTSDSQIVVNSTRFETGSVTGLIDKFSLRFFLFHSIDFLLLLLPIHSTDITDILLEKAGNLFHRNLVR